MITMVAMLMVPLVAADPLPPGDHERFIAMGEEKRGYLLHIPKNHDPKKPMPVVLALHGAAMHGRMMAAFCGMSDKADKEGFVVVYPNGTGAGPFLAWNAGSRGGVGKSDDVAFIGKLLDELGGLFAVDEKRVYACGLSNGAMMCYRLAAEMSERFAAVAPVAGTIAIAESNPKRSVSVIHFHGTKDYFVPFAPPKDRKSSLARFLSVEDSVRTWVKLNDCDEKPRASEVLSKEGDELKVTRTVHGGGKDGAEVVLVVIEGGGHTWPGMKPTVEFIGKSTLSVSANDLIWEFFQKHPRK